MWQTIWPYLAALLPTVCVAILFYFLMKNILEADRKERLAQSKWEREHDSAAGFQPGPNSDARPSASDHNESH